MLTIDQVEAFRRDGCIVMDDAVTPGLLARLRQDFAAWVEESRAHDAAYGKTIDGRPRFDLEPGHAAGAPGLRRVACPTEVSDVL